MSLRQAKIDDHWRHTFSRAYETRFAEISFTNLSCLVDASVGFRPGISAIVGANGVGKSTLAAAIAELLANCSNVEPSHRDRLRGSIAKGKAFVGNTERNLGSKDDSQGGRVADGDKFEGTFQWLDPSNLAIRCIHQIYTDQNFSDMLEPLTPLSLNNDDLAIASYLIGKEYDEVLIYEIADYHDFDVFFYFRVSSGGTQYGTESMGRGELSLLLAFSALRALPKNAILLLEEPETHVSPRSQECLMNVIAKLCDDMGVSTIITTNSPSVIRRIPVENVTLLARDRRASEVVEHPTTAQLATILGGGAAFHGALIVEDQGAKDFASAIFEEIMPELLSRFEIAVAGSRTKTSDALIGMPKTGTWLTLVGGYDGDQRAQTDTKDFRWPAVFLPGAEDPDKLLKVTLSTTQQKSELLAADFHKPPADVMVALNHIEGIDYHDFVSEMANSLNLTGGIIRRGLVRIWLKTDQNRRQAELFIKEFRTAVDSAHS
jgi:predicted ATPase